jgi:hypothetical protein
MVFSGSIRNGLGLGHGADFISVQEIHALMTVHGEGVKKDG